MKILGTGLDGLVGSRIVELLKDKHEFENLSISTGVDITDRDVILEKIKTSDAQIVLHLAAKTNVDVCEKDKALGEDGEAWKINVGGTKNMKGKKSFKLQKFLGLLFALPILIELCLNV